RQPVTRSCAGPNDKDLVGNGPEAVEVLAGVSARRMRAVSLQGRIHGVPGKDLYGLRAVTGRRARRRYRQCRTALARQPGRLLRPIRSSGTPISPPAAGLVRAGRPVPKAWPSTISRVSVRGGPG